MRKSWVIALNHFRLSLRSKSALATMFGMPLSLILIFGLLLSGGSTPATSTGRSYPIAIVDQDSSVLSRLLAERASEEPALVIDSTTTTTELDRLIADNRVIGGLIIPKGFQSALARGEAPDLELRLAPGTGLDQGARPILDRLLQQAAADYHLASHLSGGEEGGALMDQLERVADLRTRIDSGVEAEPVVRPAPESAQGTALDRSALGFAVMAVMMWILLMAGTVLAEREQGTWGRLLTTPTNRGSLTLGYLLAFWVTGLFQFAVLVGVTRVALGVEWGPILPLLAVAGGLILAAGGIGLLLAGLLRSYAQQQTVGVVVVIATSMLGGIFWPLDLLSPNLQRIGHLTPQAWAMDALTELSLRGGSWAGIALPLTVLAAIGTIFTLAGLLRLRFE